MTHIVLIIAAYLLGSIPFGLLLAKYAGKGDIRKVGSGGTGATNVMRVGGFKLAAATWVLDMAKAVAAVAIGWRFAGYDFGALCGAVAIAGHIFPAWLGFKGGKGISSMFGFMLVINPIMFAASGINWLIIALGTGYSSVGALVSLTILPILGFAAGFNIGLVCIAVSALGFYAHRENIKRLLNGTESKIEWRWKK
ncbi:MAG: glycerol-3-phosphate 1-O-acyltransferase PlsY [Alphaproteobacteria bacterium]|nr:glycerol-3-phosphate 1-O-acyltransferase PlsY [Alphaproteobacteria bacterium]